jgi:hypothetical protein
MPLTVADLTPDERADYEERAAVAEYDGGLSREDAEALALACVLETRRLTEVAK